jgi:hypothetical protein
VEGIKDTDEKVPVQLRGGYYLWFLKNQYILDHSKAPLTDPVYDTMMRAWRYTGGSPTSSQDEMISTIESWPPKKKTCFDLCMLLHSKWHPSHDQQLWVQFGFCASLDEWGEQMVADIYIKLIAICTFDEFYAAYQSSCLISLFDVKGLGSQLQNIRHLEDVLENCSVSTKSIWSLKQYVVSTVDVPLMPSVGADYGFYNCKTEEESTALKDVYRTFFNLHGSDPLKLHEAAIDGRLFQYVGPVVKLKKKFKRLMKNAYPLRALPKV